MVFVSQLAVSHCVWLINYYAHKFGYKSFDKYMNATDSYTLNFLLLGECFHNYHHVFPYVYRSSEYGTRWSNFTTSFIDFLSKIGM
ncbi:hypothetical protein PVAND_010137 [Polypedilum vanderplanki]|uniref:Uncharacterized protein n=1 Tax=Polypedilum vanderplanki TaxID=319348 RepID=A0A9J6CFS8_POLVA|nr:hypothetical protein PVAND_010137 [Polypedilum vanderplanki]